MPLKIKYILFLLLPCFVFSQIEEEHVVIKRKYEVDTKNIEKKRTNPTKKDEPKLSSTEEEKIEYTIEDIEPTSNFETSTLPAQKVESEFSNAIYNHYIKAGYGNYGKFLAEGIFTFPLKENTKVSLEYNHLSTSGFSESDIPWDSNQSRNDAEVSLFHRFDNSELLVATDFQLDKINYFGLSEKSFASANTDLENKYLNVGAKGFYRLFNHTFIDYASFEAYNISDKFDANETSIQAESKLKYDNIASDIILPDLTFGTEAEINMEHTTSNFSKFNSDFSNTNLGIAPVATFNLDKSYLKVGANLQFINHSGIVSESNFNIYPKVDFNFYGLDLFEIFAGVNGGININSYKELLSKNLYLTPNQIILPTNTKYNVFGGIKGKYADFVNYKATLGYEEIENFAFFAKSNLYDSTNLVAYNRLNGFEVNYTDANRIYVNAEVKANPIEKLEVGTSILYQNVDAKNVVYYIPDITATVFGSYKLLSNKLTLGASGTFTSNRKSNDYKLDENEMLVKTQKKLDSYFDLNATAMYSINKQFSVFVNGNNLLSSNYESYLHYPVLGIQVLGGLTFKF
ncbi:MAG: TonB-dependent receptor [Flavobacteriales bacterium]|nr:TonB-dependent receptor [Flavobacteriales bacterium]